MEYYFVTSVDTTKVLAVTTTLELAEDQAEKFFELFKGEISITKIEIGDSIQSFRGNKEKFKKHLSRRQKEINHSEQLRKISGGEIS